MLPVLSGLRQKPVSLSTATEANLSIRVIFKASCRGESWEWPNFQNPRLIGCELPLSSLIVCAPAVPLTHCHSAWGGEESGNRTSCEGAANNNALSSPPPLAPHPTCPPKAPGIQLYSRYLYSLPDAYSNLFPSHWGHSLTFGPRNIICSLPN